MTPSQSDEERAEQFARTINDGPNVVDWLTPFLTALAAVREEERMACYQLALDWAEKGDGYDIAAAIRARKHE